jgi:alanine-glyoxylate transaminase/serine-glyoxylate transaminase/serine-pyruvate transaminase
MIRYSNAASGRHFLQIPGPTNVPDRILRAIDHPTIDHRGPEFGALGRKILAEIKPIFGTKGDVVIYPASGTGAWEAALVNTLSPGDRVLMFETGHFATLWRELAERVGLEVDFVAGDWRRGVDAGIVEARLKEDRIHAIKAVLVVHNETSTGVTSRIDAVRRAIDAVHHPALLMVDTISSLASIDYRHDEWGVDVTVAGSQKGLMLPPGLSFNAISAKALAAHQTAGLARSYWDWGAMLAANKNGYFPYTPATNLLYGLHEAIEMLMEEGLANVFARHDRHAEATRSAVRAWGLELLCVNPAEYSSSLTAVLMPPGHDADAFRKRALEAYDLSLGAGLSKVAGKVFRIGHLGSFNDLMLLGTLGGVEMGLSLAGVPHKKGGVQAAMEVLTGPWPGGRAEGARARSVA